MDADTYRYLLSALMQVFGAILAGNLIFLIFRHDSLRKDQDHYRTILSDFISRLEDRFQADIPTYVKRDQPDIAVQQSEFVSRADEFLINKSTFWINIIDGEILKHHEETRQKTLDPKLFEQLFQEAAGEWRMLKEELSIRYLDYYNCLLFVGRAFSPVIKPLVGIPSILILVYATLLLAADIPCAYLLLISSVSSIVAAGGALLYLGSYIYRIIMQQYDANRKKWDEQKRKWDEQNQRVLKEWAKQQEEQAQQPPAPRTRSPERRDEP